MYIPVYDFEVWLMYMYLVFEVVMVCLFVCCCRQQALFHILVAYSMYNPVSLLSHDFLCDIVKVFAAINRVYCTNNASLLLHNLPIIPHTHTHTPTHTLYTLHTLLRLHTYTLHTLPLPPPPPPSQSLGYCQGMSSITAVLLMYLNEEVGLVSLGLTFAHLCVYVLVLVCACLYTLRGIPA